MCAMIENGAPEAITTKLPLVQVKTRENRNRMRHGLRWSETEVIWSDTTVIWGEMAVISDEMEAIREEMAVIQSGKSGMGSDLG